MSLRLVLWLSLHNALHLHATGALYSGLEGDLYSAPANCTLADLRRLVYERLDEADFARFHRATGTGIGELLDRSQQWVTRARRGDKSAADTDEISFVRAFMSNCALYAHELNAYGLHPLRALLAERMFDAQRAQHGSASHPTWESFQRDGIIVLPNFNIASNLQGVGVDRPTAMLLEMASGYRRVPLRWKRFTRTVHVAGDPQFYMHVDTFHPTWKVFVFAAGTQLENGPFHFVNGSHGAHTIGKLRWLYDRSRMHVHVDFVNHGTGSIYSMAEAASAATSAPPAQRTTTKGATAVLREGPYDDATHTVGRTVSGAIRFVGFDPKQGPAGGASVAASLSSYGLPLPTPVLVAPGGSPTLVIVDTSGFHFRGYARPGAKREAARLDGRGGGCGGCIPRKNVYACMGSAIDTVSESKSETGSTGIC